MRVLDHFLLVKEFSQSERTVKVDEEEKLNCLNPIQSYIFFLLRKEISSRSFCLSLPFLCFERFRTKGLYNKLVFEAEEVISKSYLCNFYFVCSDLINIAGSSNKSLMPVREDRKALPIIPCLFRFRVQGTEVKR